MTTHESTHESSDELTDREASSGGRFTFALAGDVDISVQKHLERHLESYTTSAAPDVLVDLTDVTFLDSTGLAFLARLRAVSESRGGSVTLSGASPAVRRLLELVGFDTVFTIG